MAHDTDVRAATTLPVVLYTIPGNAVSALPPGLVTRFATIDHDSNTESVAVPVVNTRLEALL